MINTLDADLARGIRLLYQAARSETPQYEGERARDVKEALDLLANHGWFAGETENELTAEQVTVPMLLLGIVNQVMHSLGSDRRMTTAKSLGIVVTPSGPVERVSIYASWNTGELPYFTVFTKLMDNLKEDLTLGGAVQRVDLSKSRAIPGYNHRNEITSAHVYLTVVHNYASSSAG